MDGEAMATGTQGNWSHCIHRQEAESVGHRWVLRTLSLPWMLVVLAAFFVCHHVKSQWLALPLPWVELPAMLPTTVN